MSTVDVSPDSLRTAGNDLVEAREDMVDSEYFTQLDGMGDHTNLSPGMFTAGAAAQMRLQAHNIRMKEVFATIQMNMIGLSSALHIVADVYETADHEDAFKFAFVDPDVGAPAGLPFYVDQDSSFLNPPEEDADTDDGENPVVIPDEASSPSFNAREYTVPGSAMYNGAPTMHYTETTSADGTRVVRVKEIYPDGSTNYYTNTYRDDGTVDRSDEMTFGSQRQPADWGDVADWLNAEANDIESPDRAPQS